jgi:hypothetical protein
MFSLEEEGKPKFPCRQDPELQKPMSLFRCLDDERMKTAPEPGKNIRK